jgi:ornithine cyclodeaminase/alanine dehydrogenase-like protein (mu-crystallin family)
VRILNEVDVRQLLDMDACIEGVEEAFRARGEGKPATSSVAALELDGGVLHAKLGRLDGRNRYAVAKINANFPGNLQANALPTIQGLVVLFDASCGKVLAVLDSASLTALRTAAASAVAAKHLALTGASTACFIGCGVQASAHIESLLSVRPIQRVLLCDLDQGAADRLAVEVRQRFGILAEVPRNSKAAAAESQIVVTMTPSRRPILTDADIAPGTFIAAVGADSEAKNEIAPDLMRVAVVIVDDLDQCSRFGDLRHALSAGVMALSDVRGSLDQLITGQIRGRANDGEIAIFDSTGVAIEDVAAAVLAYERAEESGAGVLVPGPGLVRPLSGRSSS